MNKTYTVYLYGYGDAVYQALSAAKARWMAYRQFREVHSADFHWFLINSRVSLVRK